MTPGNSFTTFAMSAGLFAGLLMLGAHTVRRLSAREPAGRHWLLGSLALLSPLCLLAGLATGMIGPTSRVERNPPTCPGCGKRRWC